MANDRMSLHCTCGAWFMIAKHYANAWSTRHSSADLDRWFEEHEACGPEYPAKPTLHYESDGDEIDQGPIARGLRQIADLLQHNLDLMRGWALDRAEAAAPTPAPMTPESLGLKAEPYAADEGCQRCGFGMVSERDGVVTCYRCGARMERAATP